MATKTVTQRAEMISISKEDFLAAWSLLERMVVSSDKIGSYFSHPVGKEQPPHQRQAMLEALFDYFGPDFFQEATQIRSRLDKYIDDEEGEAISDTLYYWKPRPEE